MFNRPTSKQKIGMSQFRHRHDLNNISSSGSHIPETHNVRGAKAQLYETNYKAPKIKHNVVRGKTLEKAE